MPIVTKCPSCERKLRVPDELLGKPVRCPSCKQTFTATAEGGEIPIAPLADDEESPRPAARPAPPPDEEPPQPRRPAALRSDEREDEEEPYEEEEFDEEPRRRRRRKRASRERALASVRAPAICLLATGSLGLLGDLYSLVSVVVSKPQAAQVPAGTDPNTAEAILRVQQFFAGPVGVIVTLVFLLMSATVLTGAIMMLRGKMRGLAMTGSILAMLNLGWCCCLLGLPFGIWSLIVLQKPEVVSAFE